MRSAIYYPHTRIQSESLLKTALLLWDEIKVIVPWQGYSIRYRSPSEAEAFELVGRQIYPTANEKRRVHKIVKGLTSQQLPRAFRFDRRMDGREQEYEMFAEKLLPETWELLKEARMAHDLPSRTSHMAASEPTGLLLMSLLADCCAGETCSRVTDRNDAYSRLAGLLVERIPQLDIRPTTDAQLLLVPIALKLIDPDRFTLDRLIQFRRAEERSGGSAHRSLRHRFTQHLDSFAIRIAELSSIRDRKEVEREFEDDLRIDLEDLKEALKLEAGQVLGTKEFVAVVLLAAAQFAAFSQGNSSSTIAAKITAGAGISAIGGLYALNSKFGAARLKLLKDHPTAYLYQLGGGLKW